MKIKDTNGNLIDSGEDLDVKCEDSDMSIHNMENPTQVINDEVPTLDQLKQVPTINSNIPPLPGIKEDVRPILQENTKKEVSKEKVVESTPKPTRLPPAQAPVVGGVSKAEFSRLESRVKKLEDIIKDYIEMVK